MNSTTIHLRIGDPAALVQAFVGKGLDKRPRAKGNHNQIKAYRAMVERFHAKGLTCLGKPYKRHPNFWPKLSHAEYVRQWRARRAMKEAKG